MSKRGLFLAGCSGASLGTGAAVVDGIGHSDELHALVPVLASAAVRTAALRWPLAGLLTARAPGM